MRHLKKFFEGYQNRDYTGTSDAVMSAAKMAYDISEKLLNLDREEIVNIITDILDKYQDLVFECVMGRSSIEDGDHPKLSIYFYRYNWSTGGGYFSKNDYSEMGDMSEDVIEKFADIGLYSKFYRDDLAINSRRKYSNGYDQRFMVFNVSKYPLFHYR